MSIEDLWELFDAGMFIGALLTDDPRHAEAHPLVEAARRGEVRACTTTGILSEAYATLTWQGGASSLTPSDAAEAIRALIRAPSAIRVLRDGPAATLKMLDLAAAHNLTARRIHDARHAATALIAGVSSVYTYDPDDWKVFASDGLQIVGPASTLQRLAAR